MAEVFKGGGIKSVAVDRPVMTMAKMVVRIFGDGGFKLVAERGLLLREAKRELKRGEGRERENERAMEEGNKKRFF